MRPRDVHLLHFVADDHRETGDLAVDNRDGGVTDSLSGPLCERLRRARGDQGIRYVAKMSVAPSFMPDPRDRVGVFRGGGTETDLRHVVDPTTGAG